MNAHGKHQIVVVGAGYAGLTAAQRLVRRLRADEVEVTLVTASSDFVERPRLHQVATGQDVRIVPLADLVGGMPLRVRQACVGRVDVGRHEVVLDDGAVVPYDTLVLGTGSRIAAGRVAGAREHAIALDDRQVAEDVTARLDATAAARGRVVVCGGGLTGLEIAAECAERWPDLHVSLVGGTEPGGWLSPRAKAYVDRTLDLLGVERTVARVRRVDADALVLDDGRIPFDVAFWAGGFEPSPLVAESGLETDASGRAVVDRTLRSVSHPDVWIVGDAAAVGGPWGDALAMGCRTGGFTGPAAAAAIAADLTGRAPRRLRFRYWHECLSLGRRHGVVQFLDAHGRPKDRILTGRPAIAYKNATLDGAQLLFRHPVVVTRRRHLATGMTTRAMSGARSDAGTARWAA